MGDWTNADCVSARKRYQGRAALVAFAAGDVLSAEIALKDAKTADEIKKAEKALEKAKADLESKRKWLKEAADSVIKACGEKVIEYPNGATVTFNPLIDDDNQDVQKVIEKIKSLPKKEASGIKVNLGTDPGPPMDYDSPNSKEKVKTTEAGQYKDGKIILHGNGRSERVAKHEVGHHVYRAKLSKEAREKWDRFWRGYGDNSKPNKLKEPQGKMPTDYAGSNDEDGFCECYEYLRDGMDLPQEAKKLIEELLGGIL